MEEEKEDLVEEEVIVGLSGEQESDWHELTWSRRTEVA